MAGFRSWIAAGSATLVTLVTFVLVAIPDESRGGAGTGWRPENCTHGASSAGCDSSEQSGQAAASLIRAAAPKPQATTTLRPKGPRLAILLNQLSGRRFYARQDFDGEDGIGALAAGPVEQDQIWRFERRAFSLYIISNVASGRRLFARWNQTDQVGVGAISGGPMYDDQLWILMKQKDGSYLVQSFGSGRRLYAELGKTGFDGIGARPEGKKEQQDQKWLLVEQVGLPQH